MSLGNVRVLAIDEPYLFTVTPDSNTVGVIDTTSMTGTPLVTNQPNAYDLALDAPHIYWINRGTSGSDGAVMVSNRDGSNVQTLAMGQAKPNAIAVDNDAVYWLNEGQFGNDGGVYKVKKDGTGLTTLSGVFQPSAIVVTSQYVFWTDTSYGTVYRASKDGQNKVTFASNQGLTYAMVGDDSALFWADYVHGTILKKAPDADPSLDPTTLVSGQFNPRYITFDASSIYWLSINGIWKSSHDGANVTAVVPDGYGAVPNGQPHAPAVGATSFYYYLYGGTLIDVSPK